MPVALALLAVFLVTTVADATSRAKRCRRECREEVSDCFFSNVEMRLGDCKRLVRRRCRRAGPEICLPPSTTTTTSTTSTSLGSPGETTTTLTEATTTTTFPLTPRTVGGYVTNDVCGGGLLDVAHLILDIAPSVGLINFRVHTLIPGYFFCWPNDLLFVQGARQVGVTTAESPDAARLIVNEDDAPCESYPPYSTLTGTIDRFPVGFDLAAPFTLSFDYRFCSPQWCGLCELPAP